MIEPATWFRSLVAVVVATSLAAGGSPAPENYGAAPAVDRVRISPGGDRVVAVVSGEGRSGAAVADVATGKLTVVLQPDRRTQLLDACDWASNDRVVCSMFVFRRTRDGPPYPRRRLVRLVAVDHDGGELLALLDRPPARTPRMGGVYSVADIPFFDMEHVVVDHLPADPRHVLVAAPREATPYTTVYRVDVRTGAHVPIVGWQPGISFWSTDREGRVRVGTGQYEYGPGRYIDEPWKGPTAVAADAAGRLLRVDVAELSGRIGTKEIVGPRVLGFSDDGARAYYEGRVRGADRAALWEAEVETLRPLRRIAAHPVRDVRAAVVAGRDCGVVGFAHPLPGRPFTWLDAGFGRDVEAAAARLVGEVVAVPSMSADCRRLVLVATDWRTRRSFHLLDRADGTVRSLGEQYPAIADGHLSERRSVRYRTRDGLDLPMVLTLPMSAAPRPPPVVVLLTYEEAADGVASLDTWPHFFARRGYAVAQPAVRGAKGYGTEFHVAGLHRRAAKLQEDVEDALAQLAVEGLGDPTRVCFAGRGRSGHLALVAASTDRPDSPAGRRCAAAFAALEVRSTRRGHHNPFDADLCNFFPCGDWMRWAAHDVIRKRPFAPSRWREENVPKSSLLRSPLADFAHPGFPVLIQGGGDGTVHLGNTKRFRADVQLLRFFEHVAPVGSDAETEFLAAAAALLGEVLGNERNDGITPAVPETTERPSPTDEKPPKR